MFLDGAEKYREKPTEDPRRRGRSDLIEQANAVPIQDVLKDLFGIHVPLELEKSWKTDCPFGFEHADGGIDKNFRVYPTNTAYCFAMHGGLSPVRLVMMQRDLPPTRAAQVLADRYGLAKREPYWEKMNRLILERETASTSTGSPEHAVEAMQTALERIPGYSARQFEERILAAVEERLEELDVAIRSREAGAVREWLAETTKYVTEQLEETE